MQYRDERDALRGRVDSLEEQLAAARKELEDHRDDDRAARVAQIEVQMEEARRVLDQLGRELDEVRGRPRRSPSAPLLGAIAVLALAGGAASYFYTLRSGSSVTSTIEPQPAPVVPPSLQPTPPPAVPALPPEPEPEPAPVAPEAPPPDVQRTATAIWKANVTRATGLPLAAGAACTVEAKLTSPGDKISVSEVQVLCGGTPLYRSSDSLNGMSMLRSGVEEDSGAAPGTHVYALTYEDKGSRTGPRAEVSIDTIRKSGAAWSDSAPAYRVELKLPYQSAPVKGDALLDATVRSLRRSARVTASTGPSPVKAGAKCTLRATPLARPGKCLTRLECGGRMIYGAGTTGVSECTVEADMVVRVHDGNTTANGGDPAFDLDLATGEVTVRDEVGGAAWTAHVKLDGSSAPATP